MARSMPEAPKTWILTGSPESFDATRGHGFRADADPALPVHRTRAAAGTLA